MATTRSWPSTYGGCFRSDASSSRPGRASQALALEESQQASVVMSSLPLPPEMGHPPAPDRRSSFRTKGVTTPALAPRARADTNAGLATVDDVCLATRQTHVERRSSALDVRLAREPPRIRA
jgi:hypothetical protein